MDPEVHDLKEGLDMVEEKAQRAGLGQAQRGVISAVHAPLTCVAGPCCRFDYRPAPPLSPRADIDQGLASPIAVRQPSPHLPDFTLLGAPIRV